MELLQGHIHSIETCGTVDGPGIRFVVFFQGCPLRCVYCHNPDTWEAGAGRAVTVGELMAEAGRYRSYMRASGGGITLTGGEPLLQADFVEALFARCREEGIHTALDTSGAISPELAIAAYEKTDLVLLDFKAYYADQFERVTGVPIRNLIRTCNYLENKQIPVWIRFVLIPGLTDNPDEIGEMADYLAGLGNIEQVEIIPFHKMGEYKWEQLGLAYTLRETRPPSPELTERVAFAFLEAGLTVV